MTSRLFNTKQEMFEILPKGGVVAEIGVFKGDGSRHILDDMKPEKLHLIDAWRTNLTNDSTNAEQMVLDERYTKVFTRFYRDINVEIHRNISWEAATIFPNYYFDWIYLDACHRYDDVLRDLKAFYPKIKLGGYITGDDYIVNPNYGVIEAVRDFCIEIDIPIITDIPQIHQASQFMIQIPE